MPRSSFQLLLLHTIIDPLYYIGPILGRFRDNVFQVNGTGGVISIWDIKGHQKSSESLFLWVVSELCFWLTLCRDKKQRWVCEVVYYPMASNSLIYWRAGEHNILEGESSTNWSAPAQLGRHSMEAIAGIGRCWTSARRFKLQCFYVSVWQGHSRKFAKSEWLYRERLKWGQCDLYSFYFSLTLRCW